MGMAKPPFGDTTSGYFGNQPYYTTTQVTFNLPPTNSNMVYVTPVKQDT